MPMNFPGKIGLIWDLEAVLLVPGLIELGVWEELMFIDDDDDANKRKVKFIWPAVDKKQTSLKYTCNKQSDCSRHALRQWRIFAAID